MTDRAYDIAKELYYLLEVIRSRGGDTKDGQIMAIAFALRTREYELKKDTITDEGWYSKPQEEP